MTITTKQQKVSVELRGGMYYITFHKWNLLILRSGNDLVTIRDILEMEHKLLRIKGEVICQ